MKERQPHDKLPPVVNKITRVLTNLQITIVLFVVAYGVFGQSFERLAPFLSFMVSMFVALELVNRRES